MVRKRISIEILQALDEAGLNSEESLIYYTLLKYGINGATVRKLNLELTEIERTSIYPILQKLINKQWVTGQKSSETLKKAMLFIATEPNKMYQAILSKKENELKKFIEKTKIFTNRLQDIYLREQEFVIEDIYPIIQPYLRKLLENKWKVQNQMYTKGINIFGYDFYRYDIYPPGTVTSQVWYNGFHVYVFNKIITSIINFQENPYLDKNNEELKYALIQIKRLAQERFLREYKDVKVKMRETDINFLGQKLYSLKFDVKNKNDTRYREALVSIIFSIENKVFFIWGIDEKIILDIFNSILNAENISFDK